MKVRQTVWIILGLAVLYTPYAPAAQVGIKYNRGKAEYPTAVLADFQRFHEDRIDTVMITLPWNDWESSEGEINPTLLNNLTSVLDYCEQNDMTVVIGNHCVYWGTSGDWTIPTWIRNKEDYIAATSCLTVPEIRTDHVQFIERLINATQNHPAVVGYNILNEPVAATAWYVNDPAGRTQFDARWEGVIDITQRVRQYMDTAGVTQYMTVGMAPSEPGYESYIWEHNGQTDLTAFYTQMQNIIGSQRASGLEQADQWYADSTKIRTEGRLYEAGLYDYNAAYEHEGLANAAVQNMDAFYAWRIGSPDGPWTPHLNLFDDRNNTRATPYYWALRDLASGIDSFETILDADLPATDGTSQAEFDPTTARAGISNRWTGTGQIVAQKDLLPPQAPLSTMAATITLDPSENMARSVIATHWIDSGVTAGDAFRFLARTDDDCEVWLIVHSPESGWAKTINLAGGDWNFYEVSFVALGLEYEDISQITDITFFNFSEETISFDIDEFLIRPAIRIPGDANGDGVVSAGDYASVQANFGNTGEPGMPGDANGDGVVSAGDYASVQANFGRTEGIISANQTPEPTTLTLLTVGLVTLLRKKRQKIHLQSKSVLYPI